MLNGRRRINALAIALALGLPAAAVAAGRGEQVPAGDGATASALLAVDRHRTTIVERIVNEWGARLVASNQGIDREQLRTILFAMRADQLLAASLAGSLDGLRDVAARALVAPAAASERVQAEALGDPGSDVAYVPVTPCRLVETRAVYAAVYQGAGPFSAGEVRNYTVQGGNGMCLTQLPAGINPAAVQLQVFGIPVNGVSGDIEILPQGASFGSSATLVFLGNLPFTSASTTARVNQANRQIGVQVRTGIADMAIDVVGYFAAPSGSGGRYFRQGANAFGVTAVIGTTDNNTFDVQVNGGRVMRYDPNGISPNVVGGHANNGALVGNAGQTIAGGGLAGSNCVDPATGASTRSCGNLVLNDFATVGGGLSNTASGTGSNITGGSTNTTIGDYSTIAGGMTNIASGDYSTVAGGQANVASGHSSFAAGTNAKARESGMFVWSDNGSFDYDPTTFRAVGQSVNTFNVRATGGVMLTTGIDAGGVPNWSCYTYNGGGWTCTSDRNQKRNLVELDGQDVLARLAAMPIYQWQPRTGPYAEVKHFGPMAQDFKAAFGLGHDDKAIGLQDAEGVALAAIQGLNAKLGAALASGDGEIAVLRNRVADLEAAQARAAVQRQELAELRRAVDALQARALPAGDASRSR